MIGLIGKKLGMTQVYDDAGTLHAVTVVQLGPCTVMQVKTTETDGYAAVQLGFEDKERQKALKEHDLQDLHQSLLRWPIRVSQREWKLVQRSS